MKIIKLITQRLIIRDFKSGDEENIRDNVDNLKVSKYLAVVPYHYSKKDAMWFVNHCKEEQKKKPRTSYELGIELKEDSKIIGCIGLTSINKYDGTATFGYWLGEKYWKQGIMTEASERILRFAFNQLKLRRINVGAYTGNKASHALIKKLGFRYEGTCIKSHRTKSTGRLVDSNIYGLLKSEWKRG